MLIQMKEEELGFIDNLNGCPRVALDDKYLEPYTADLLLRQNEFKKWLGIF